MSETEKTVVKGLSFNGVAQDGNTVQVDLKDGKIVRIRPFRLEYERKPWRMEARGVQHDGHGESKVIPCRPRLQSRTAVAHWFTELGIRQICVCPDANYGTAVHADKWIPILPNTDAALNMAIACQ